MGFLTGRLRASSQCKPLWEKGVSQPWHYWQLGLGHSLSGFPGGVSDKEPACQCMRPKRCRFDPWVRKILWRRAWQPTPVFLPENPMDRGAWWAIVHSGVADSYPVCCRMSRVVPGVCSLDSSSTLPIGTHTHTHTYTQNVSRHCQMSHEGPKKASFENHNFRKPKVFLEVLPHSVG